jgi:hypothetical protein
MRFIKNSDYEGGEIFRGEHGSIIGFLGDINVSEVS